MSRVLGVRLVLPQLLRKKYRDLNLLKCEFCSFYYPRDNKVKLGINTSYICNYLGTRYFHTSFYLDDIRTVNVPPFAESISEGDIYFKKSAGDKVTIDEIVAEIETDKTNISVLASCSGVITEILVEDGSKVVADQALLKIEGDISSETKVVTTTEPITKLSEPKAEISQSKKPAVAFTDNKTITESSKPSPPTLSKSSMSPGLSDCLRGEQRVKMSRIRLRIAERLKDAQNTCAMLSTFNEIDMTNLFELRRQYKDSFLKKHNVKLGMMSTFAKASAIALFDQPAVNAVIDGTDIIYRDYVDISIAVATPKGLVVPVLRNVEKMNYADIELKIQEMGMKAREGTLAVEDMDGGTFTISNGGIFGSLFGTPIINPPQSAILGLYGVFDRPVARNGQVVIRPMMYVVLTYDHRLIDGREAVLFLRKIKEFVEDPRIFFLQI